MSTHDGDDLKSGKGKGAPPQTVGYGNPPKATRFKKGHSGNPKGRPRGSVSLQQLIRKQLNHKVTVTIGTRRRTVTRREAIAMTIVASGLKSDPRAVATILQVEALSEHQVEEPDPNTPLRDDEIVAALRRRFEHAARLSARASEIKRDRSASQPASDPDAARGSHE
jgi:hypothetical protein